MAGMVAVESQRGPSLDEAGFEAVGPLGGGMVAPTAGAASPVNQSVILHRFKARLVPEGSVVSIALNRGTNGTNLALARLSDEAVTRRLPRRLSRIAKGRLTRCSEHAHARIAKGGGLLGKTTLPLSYPSDQLRIEQ